MEGAGGQGHAAAAGAAAERGTWHAQLHNNRAAAHLKLADYRRAYDEATSALQVDEAYAKARWRRASALAGLGGAANLTDAKMDLNIAAQLLRADLSKNGAQKLLDEVLAGLAAVEAQLENPGAAAAAAAAAGAQPKAKKRPHPQGSGTYGTDNPRRSSSGSDGSADGGGAPGGLALHLEVLGLAPTATPDDVRKAFRKLALKWHPDKWAGKSEAEKEAAGAEFRKLTAARDALCDALKGGRSLGRSASVTPRDQGGARRGAPKANPGSAGFFSNWSSTTGGARSSGSKSSGRRTPRCARGNAGGAAKSPFTPFVG